VDDAFDQQLVRDYEVAAVAGVDVGVGEGDVGDPPLVLVEGDAVADPERLRIRVDATAANVRAIQGLRAETMHATFDVIDKTYGSFDAFRRDALFRALPKLDRNNRQHEYYLNRVYPMFAARGERLEAVPCDTGGAFGLNSRRGLADVVRVVRGRINERHMANGVTLTDPAATYIDVGVRIGSDTTIAPNVYLEGDTVVGRGCAIGPSVRVVDSSIGDRSSVQFAVVLGSTIGRDVAVGPFVRMRPGVVMHDGSKAGAFVDLKAATVGRGSKVPHLSYVGDAEIGEDVNIGAGTITINFDGYDKHRTVIEDGARIGSDTMLIAPVRVGRDANTGAGSVITKDVPPGALAVERAEQKNVAGYRDRKDAEHRRGRR